MEEYLLYYELKPFQSLLERTKKFIRNSLQKVSNPYVACSFGKDSSVMLHLILQERNDIPVRVVIHPETFFLDRYREVIDWWKEKYKINLKEIYCERDTFFVEKEQGKGQRARLNEGNYDAFFVGIRAEESLARSITLKHHGTFYFVKKWQKYRIAPLAWWKLSDVAAYMVYHQLPVLATYEFFGFEARTTTGVPVKDRKPFLPTYTSLSQLKMRDPIAFNQLAKKFPEVRFFV
jgi:3'-phosphoadenosine 5'-phosphosulfate sulfotransferase (PAPS reductase)/FAD synthetase